MVHFFTTSQSNTIYSRISRYLELSCKLPITTRREICPPVGNPFHGLNLNTLPNMTFFSLKTETVNIIEHMVYRGINNASRALGANYVLCALTLVNTNAAVHLPWLYQSVAH